MVTVTMIDETGIGNKTLEKTFHFQNTSISLRDLIRQRVFEEVQDYNAKQPLVFQGLVQPSEAEQTLNGIKQRKARVLDWQKQFTKAVEAFEARSFIVIGNDKQIDDLDELLDLSSLKELNFLKLVPLIGG